ncbi:MAG TPA: HNH/ENDO VII family nuclease, partial [Duganella sp.]|nr:HNH/ENDO VII family nuclease [Duganella sp.]
AGAFVGSAVATQVAGGLARMDVFSDGAANAATLSNSAKFAISTISGVAAGITTSVMRGGKINLTQIATDAFGNALGSSLVDAINSTDYMQTRQLRSGINAERSARGLSPIDSNDQDSMDAILDIVQARGRKTVGGRLMGYADQLRMYGVDESDVTQVIGSLNDSFHGRADVTAVPGVDMSDENKAILTGLPTPERTAAFGLMAVDNVLQGAGRLVKSFGDTLANTPWARYALEGIDFAAGPAIWAARKAVTELTPVGEMIEHGQEKIVGMFADRFASAGYSADDATVGGLGGLTLGTMMSSGAAGALGRLSGLSNMLASVRNRLSAMAPDVNISPFIPSLSQGQKIQGANSLEAKGRAGKTFADNEIFTNRTEWSATRPRGTGQTYEVIQRNDIDWARVRTDGPADFIGRTNAEAAAKGFSPQLADDSFSTLHHIGQDARGPLAEASTGYHGIGKPGQDALHSLYGRNMPHPDFPIDRRAFNVDTREYWKWRLDNQ